MKPARDRILASAERLHRKEGLAALSLRAVARDVGVTPMAIYRYFKDKDALIEALAEAAFEKWEVVLAEAVRARTPLKVLERTLLAYAEFALAEPHAFELMLLIPRPAIPTAPASLKRSPSNSFEVVIAAVRDAMESGTLVRDDPAEVILLCWAMAHGLIALHSTGRFGHDDSVFRAVYAREVKRLLKLLARSTQER